jgi:hypothetical protein
VTAPIHDVVVGPAGPTRNNVVANLIAADLVSRTVEPWLIDVYDVHRSMVVWPARTLTEARNMLADLNTFRPNDRGQDLCITIQDASVVLQDRQIRNNLEDILRAATLAGVKFRLAVVSLDAATGFGGSKVIRAEVIGGNIIGTNGGKK